MQLREVAERLRWTCLSGKAALEREVTGGYCGDLLSHALTAAKPGYLWITIQQHANVVAVAQVNDLAGVLVAAGGRPDAATLEKARTGGVAVLSSPEPAFSAAGRLYDLLRNPT
jgi:hypothetical protein